MAKMGRPSLYSDKLADSICEQIASGESLVAICAAKGMPNEATIYRWLNDKPDFCEKYARARDRLADRFAHDVVEIADKADPQTMRGIEHARTRIDARKWAAGKLAPKKYGDLKRTELTGANGGPVQYADLSKLSDAALAELAAALAAGD